MSKWIVIVVFAVAVLVTISVVLVSFVYFSNRTVDQTVAMQIPVAGAWTDLTPDSPLTKTRRVQEIDLEISGFRYDVGDHLPWGQIRLPDGNIISPQIEAYDEAGNRHEFHHSGYTMSREDLIVYSPIQHLSDEVRLTKIRIRSDQPFACEHLFWRNRNPK